MGLVDAVAVPLGVLKRALKDIAFDGFAGDGHDIGPQPMEPVGQPVVLAVEKDVDGWELSPAFIRSP